MCTWLFINPVALAMYDTPQLRAQLAQKGYRLAHCQTDHARAVLDQYRAALADAPATLADMRCPPAAEHIRRAYPDAPVQYPPIEPILLHCARELQANLRAGETLYVTTPCAALRDRGRALALPGTHFYTWAEFITHAQLTLPPPRTLAASPIPPGFFAAIDAPVAVLDSRERIDEYFTAHAGRPAHALLELLYCAQGCHNGDGLHVES